MSYEVSDGFELDSAFLCFVCLAKIGLAGEDDTGGTGTDKVAPVESTHDKSKMGSSRSGRAQRLRLRILD